MSIYRKLVLDISQCITCEDGSLNELKYLCGDLLPCGICETITTPLQLFEELEKRGNVGLDNLDFFIDLLTNAKYLKLAGLVRDLKLKIELQRLSLSKNHGRGSFCTCKHNQTGSSSSVHTENGQNEEEVSTEERSYSKRGNDEKVATDGIEQETRLNQPKINDNDKKSSPPNVKGTR